MKYKQKYGRHATFDAITCITRDIFSNKTYYVICVVVYNRRKVANNPPANLEHRSVSHPSVLTGVPFTVVNYGISYQDVV